MKTALAVSPHLDDAAFSAGATLNRLARAGWRVVVATVFTGSTPDPQGFALACQLDKGLGPEVDYMALRRAEDDDACRRLGAQARQLPFLEAPHRGYASAPALFAGVRGDDRAAEAVAPALEALLDELAPDLVLAPQAVGAHADHQVVVRALDVAGPAAPVLWWRDHPYALRRERSAEPFADRFAACASISIAFDDEARRAKLAASLAYTTQIGFQYGGPGGLRAALDAAPSREEFRITKGEGLPEVLTRAA